MRKITISGQSLDLRSNHFFDMQADLLDCLQNILTSIGSEFFTAGARFHTCELTQVDGVFYISGGYCMINGLLLNVTPGNTTIPPGSDNFSIVLAKVEDLDSIDHDYDYKKFNDVTTYNGCIVQQAELILVENDFIGYNDNDWLLVCGRDDVSGLTTEDSIIKSKKVFSLSNVLKNEKNFQDKTLESVSTFKYGERNVITKYFDITGWNMTVEDTPSSGQTKTIVYFPDGFALNENNVSVLSWSVSLHIDNNVYAENNITKIEFASDRATLYAPLKTGEFWDDTTHRGYLKIEAFDYCQKW